jgi:large exoprotein involved in heme utilization and adhesion
VNENEAAATSVEVIGESRLAAQASEPDGNAGSVTINARQLTAREQAAISASNISGESRDIILQGVETLSLNNSVIEASTQTGRAGSIRVNENQAAATSVALIDSNLVVEAEEAGGDAGSITINTQQLTSDRSRISAENISGASEGIILRGLETLSLNNSVIEASTRTGLAGSIEVNADEAAATSVALTDSSLVVEARDAGGDAGRILLNTQQLTSDRSRISAENISGASEGIILRGLQTLSLNNSEIEASTRTGLAGSIEVNVDEAAATSVALTDSSLVVEARDAGGDAGRILLNTQQLTSDRSRISAENISGVSEGITLRGLETLSLNSGLISSSTQSGVAGSVSVDASESVTVTNGLISSSSSSGVAGSVTINALDSVTLNGIFNTTPTGEPQGGVLATATEGGTAGSVTINTEGLTIQNGAAAAVSSKAGSGIAGDIQIEAEEVTLNSGGRIEAQTDAGGSDRPANIILQGLETLDINDGFISSSTESGVAGSVSIDASESVTVNNGSISSSSNSGVAGSVSIDASQLELNDGTISASTTSTNPINNGIAGNVSINASDSVELDNGSRIAVTAAGDNGTAGDVIINTGDFLVLDGSEVSVSSEGVAGSLNVKADFIELNQGRLTAEAGQGEGGANINLDVSGFLRLDNESLLSALATGNATGGNININAQYVLASFPTGSQGSDIVADAVLGNGGQISITALGIFGLDFRPARTPLNDITASSQGGAAGTVQITTLGIDPSRGLAALPLNFIDVSGLVGGQCSASGADGELSQFTIIGRGGLPLNPTDPLAPEAEASDWVTFDPESDRISPQAHIPIRITPFTSSVTPQQLAQFPSLCYQSWSTSAIAP